MGHEPAKAGRQRHRLGPPELWEVTVTSHTVCSAPTGFQFEADGGLRTSGLACVFTLSFL